jgi:hypothetical protein
MKRFLKLSSDKERITFFAWSHIAGWFLANLQTIWILVEMRRNLKIILKAIKENK